METGFFSACLFMFPHPKFKRGTRKLKIPRPDTPTDYAT